MQTLIRITGMSWRYKQRLIIAYIAFFGSIAAALSIVWIIGHAVDLLVVLDGGKIVSLSDVTRSTLIMWAGILMAVGLSRGALDGVRTYLVDTLAQKVSYDLRNSFYDKLQHLSFAFHDKEHTGSLMSNATSDVEAVRRFVMMGLVRSIEVGVRPDSAGNLADVHQLGIDPDLHSFRAFRLL